jgi:hypothetical protein
MCPKNPSCFKPDLDIIEAFSRLELEAAWSFAKKFGFKVPMVICRHSLLTLMFLVTPTNRNDASGLKLGQPLDKFR